jgi:hypothetical protein
VRSSRSILNRNRKLNVAVACLLACVLALVQQIGYAHALSHLANPFAPRPIRGDTPHPAEKVCTQCASIAQLGSALPAQTVPTPIVAVVYERPSVALAREHFPSGSPPFLSRAPPR